MNVTPAKIAKHSVLTCTEMAAADSATIASGRFTGIQLMEDAGAAVADAVLCHHGAAPRVHVLCGPGNNGGDGYVAARILAERGVTVALYALGDPKPGTDAQLAAATWKGPVGALPSFMPEASDCVIDALFGAGFAGQLPEVARDALDRAAKACAQIVAIDLPSGLHGDTGLGAGAVACAHTVTFYRPKPAHLLVPSRGLCGDIVVADIGVRAEEPPSIVHNAPDWWLPEFPTAGAASHKYTRGHVAVFSGPPLATGASRLSALAAASVGAGAVTLLGTAEALHIHAAHVTSIMLREAIATDIARVFQALKGLSAIVLGPGFGDFDAVGGLVRSILEETDAILVLDADGISAFAGDPAALFCLASRHRGRVVLTPHAGEFARLFPEIAGQSNGKWAKAKEAAALSGAIIVFKGPDTIIAAPDGPVVINTHAHPALATAGSGDVLAGAIAGLAGQGMRAFQAACAGVWLHGDAGIRAGPVTTADRLPDALNAAVNGVIVDGC